MGFKDEIGKMNTSFGYTSDQTEVPETEAPPTDAPGTDAPATEVPGTEVPTTDIPKEGFQTDPPTTEAPDERDEIIRELREKLEEKEKKKESKTDAPTTDIPLTLNEVDFLKDLEDLDEVVRDPEKLNKLLNAVRQDTVNETRKVLGEGILRSIPDIVKTNIALVTNLKKTSDKFYEDNEDLKPFKKVVAAVFEELSSENPDKKYGEIMREVGPEVRTRLSLQKNAGKKKSDPPTLPRKRSKPGLPKEKNKPGELSSQIAEMNKVLGG